MLPIFSLETHVTYYCSDGVITSDLEEAKAHGYGQERSTATSFGHGNAFATFDYSVLPEIENLSLELGKCYGVFLLKYYSGGEEIMRQEVWYTSEQIKNGCLEPLVGTAENPYNFLYMGLCTKIYAGDP